MLKDNPILPTVDLGPESRDAAVLLYKLLLAPPITGCPYPIDSYYCAKFREAVEDFQQLTDIPMTGCIDGATRNEFARRISCDLFNLTVAQIAGGHTRIHDPTHPGECLHWPGELGWHHAA